MMLTQKQLEQRRGHFTATAVVKALGLAPWKDATATSVYYDEVSPQLDREPSEAMTMGSWLEIPLIQFAVKRLRASAVRSNLFRVSKGQDNGLLSCTLDARLRNRLNEAIEAKYVGPDYVDDWGEDDTDQVPVYVAAQVQTQMYVAELETVWVAAFLALPRPERRLYRVDRDAGVIDMLVSFAVGWWKDHIVARVPPTDAPPPMEILRAMKRMPKTLAVVKPELVEAWHAAHGIKAWAGRLVKRADHAVLTAMGDAEAVDGGHAGLVTYLEHIRKGYTVAAKPIRVLRPKGVKRAELKRIGIVRTDRKQIGTA